MEGGFFILAVMGLLITPGPTNTLLAVAGFTQGARSSLTLIPCELAGYLLAIGLWGGVFDRLEAYWPWLPTIARIASALYILYLAIKMWRRASHAVLGANTPVSPGGLFFATMLNPKALLFAIAIFPSSAFQSLNGFLLYAAIFSLLLTLIAALWIWVGVVLAKGRTQWINTFVIQRGASFVLLSFSLSIGWSVL